METISHTIEINATAEEIWKILWDKSTYAEWTKFFGEENGTTGTYESDWKVGGRTVFLDSTGQNGLISTIQSLNEPYEVVFKHLGYIENGEEITDSKEIEEWSGAQEKYFLTELEDYTKLQGELQTMSEYAENMKNGFVKGFERVKKLAENRKNILGGL